MMKKIKEKVLKMDFGKTARHFTIAAVVIIVIGAIVGGITVWPQVSEIVALKESYKQSMQDLKQQEDKVSCIIK